MRINQRYRSRLYWGREEANHLLSFISSPLLNPLFPTSVRAVCTFVSLAPHASSLACHCVTFSIVSMVNCYSSPKIQLKKFSPCLSHTHTHALQCSLLILSTLHTYFHKVKKDWIANMLYVYPLLHTHTPDCEPFEGIDTGVPSL